MVQTHGIGKKRFKNLEFSLWITLTKVFYTYGPNLVILAWTGDEL